MKKQNDDFFVSLNGMKGMNKKGQAVLEAVLLAVVLVIVFQGLSVFLKRSDFVQNIIGEPWKYLSNSIHYGVWTKNPNEGKAKHPNHTGRHVSLEGDLL